MLVRMLSSDSGGMMTGSSQSLSYCVMHSREVLGNLGASNRRVESIPSIQVATAMCVQPALAHQDAGNLAGAIGAEIDIIFDDMPKMKAIMRF